MVVMQFAYEGPPSNSHRLENHRARTRRLRRHARLRHRARLVADALRARPRRATGLPGIEPHWELTEAALSSRAELAIVQAQDILGLGSEARMNMPGTSKGNWRWRLRPRAADEGACGAVARADRAPPLVWPAERAGKLST